jgi:hypothetical protein
MSERPEDLEDDALGERLKRSLGATPGRLSFRLERLTAAGLRPVGPEDRPRLPWRELGLQLIGLGLAVALVVGVLTRLTDVIAFATPISHTLWETVASPVSLELLALPIGVLLLVEAMRGAPTLRRWLR